MAKIGRDEILEAAQTYREYKAGKANLDRRLVENEQWFKMQHWRGLRPDKARKQTGWLHAAIINKHADFMDNKPEATVLPREQSDEETAKALTDILPVVLDRGGWDEAYDQACLDKVKSGGGIYGVYWDPKLSEGLGDVRIEAIDPLSVYWQPGIEDLSDSRNMFLTELLDNELIKELYPKNKELDRLGGQSEMRTQYVQDEQIDTSDKSLVISWYYKREGKLHYCRFVNDIVLFASENDDRYKESGWYADGAYPFVIDPMFREPGTPYGFGTIDTMRDTQEDIDQLNQLQMDNAKIASKRRYFVRTDANINEDEFRDLNNDIVHFAGSLTDMSIKEIASEQFSGTYVQILDNKIQELKENAFTRDVTTGGSGSQNTAAGLAAMQEAGAKSSRDAIQGTYRAFKQVVLLVIERIRQFYDVPHVFRILGDDKTARYETFDNAALIGRPIGPGIGTDFGSKKPIFDLDVRVNKANVWSRQAQNQDVINFFNMGFFNPQMSTQALACLEVLDIDNKEKLTQTIRQNGLREQFIQQFLPVLIQAVMLVDQNLAAAALQAAQAAGMMQAQPTGGAPQPEEAGGVTGQMQRSERYMDNQRAIANARTAPQA